MVLGYENKAIKPRIKVERKPHIPEKRKHKQDCDVSVHNVDLIFHEDENIETITQTDVDVFQHVIDDHSYCRDINTTKCADCEAKGEVI